MNKDTLLIYDTFNALINILEFGDNIIGNSYIYESQCLELLSEMDISNKENQAIKIAMKNTDWEDLGSSVK